MRYFYFSGLEWPFCGTYTDLEKSEYYIISSEFYLGGLFMVEYLKCATPKMQPMMRFFQSNRAYKTLQTNAKTYFAYSQINLRSSYYASGYQCNLQCKKRADKQIL